MSIQEKKSNKGTPFAIVKFSDIDGEFELFLFSENLISNREKLNEAESFVLTLQKDTINRDTNQVRVNVKKILRLSEMVNKEYNKVSIEIDGSSDIKELKGFLSQKGNTEIEIIIKDKDKKFTFNLENHRKFDLNILRNVKSKQYVKKITF